MDEEINIIYLNQSVLITKFNSESKKRFEEKINFIRLLENDNLSWKDANKLSKIWVNIRYFKMKYHQDIYKKYDYYNKLYNSKYTN